MKVALLAPRFPPAFDGVGDHAAHVAGALVRAGHDVVVVTETPDAVPPDGGRLVRVHDWTANEFGRVWRELAALRPDRLLVEYTPFNFGARTFVPHVLAAALRARGTGIATFMHEGFYRPSGTNPMHPLRAAILGVRDAAMVAASHVTFSASAERLEAVRKAIPFFGSRLRTLPIGANVEPGDAQRWTPPSRSPIRLLMFGVVAPRRRIDLAIETVARAARRSIHLDLTVVGRIYDERYADACVQSARRHGIADRVRFTRELPPHAVTAAFLDADLAVHALYEGTISSSGSLLAAFAHGVPLLAVRTRRDEARLVTCVAATSEDPETMLRDALAVTRSPDRGAALGARARDMYERDFRWERIAAAAIESTDRVPLEKAIRARA
jgi:glycosyltransferase involved in cell wall biosynthesis